MTSEQCRRTCAAVPAAQAERPEGAGSVPTIRDITLRAAGARLSGLVAEAPDRPRAVVVALHGAGMGARYFDCRTCPGQSLLELGARSGYTVLALDRPGYGASARHFPEGQGRAEQAATIRAAMDEFADRFPIGEGFFLLAHSYGGKLALSLAADDRRGELLGLDISGCGHRYAVPPDLLVRTDRHRWKLDWGKLRCYPPGTFRFSQEVVSAIPAREARDAARWPEHFPWLAARVRAPVRLTFAEHEHWWRHEEADVVDLAASFGATRVTIERQDVTGHNISLGWTARSYHLRALAFLEECLSRRDQVTIPARSGSGRAGENWLTSSALEVRGSTG